MVNGKIPPEGTGRIGLMAYYHPKNMSESWDPVKNNIIYGDQYVYSESIQCKLFQPLMKYKKYCFKTQILLFQHAGLSIDKFGVNFSENKVIYRS